MDTTGRWTNATDVDGEVVWSWPPGAEAVQRRLRVVQGARKPVPKESTYKP
jgi:hypothetical protein